MSPIVVMMIFGTIDICSMYYLRQSLKLAAYESCRMGVTPGCSDSTCRYQAELLLKGRKVKDYAITVTPAPENLADGQYLSVRVTAPTGSNLPLKGWFTLGRNAIGEVSMMNER